MCQLELLILEALWVLKIDIHMIRVINMISKIHISGKIYDLIKMQELM